MKRLLVIMLAVVMSGCYMIPSKPEFSFPSDIDAQCKQSRDSARAKIESKGTKLKTKKGCHVVKVPGERKVRGLWAWKDKSFNAYVCGLCNGRTVWIAVDPNNQTSLNAGVLEHEFGHYWLMTNYGNYTHDPVYDSVFDHWKGSRAATGKGAFSTKEVSKKYVTKTLKHAKEGEIVSINYMEDNGTVIHIDFIKVSTNDTSELK